MNYFAYCEIMPYYEPVYGHYISPFNIFWNTYCTYIAVNGVTPIIISYAIIPNDHMSLDG